ncbi:MAG: arylsulfatase [Rikenellaceae bacterium]
MKQSLVVVAVVATTVQSCSKTAEATKKPNVIIILTDDQGLGGLACQGNPYLKTPNIDNFYAESVRMTDFHVSPLSTPTRSAIITGRYPVRNGAWATFKGRDVIARNNKTIAEIFHDGGYLTAQFGKWHLGDNYPSRPTDCGFEYSLQHRSGGVGELSDYWGNTYFDDVYLENNTPKQFEGYCTDVWFSETQKYIEKHKDDDKPFFIYLATNAPHSPHYVDEKYSAPYEYLKDDGIIQEPGFYGQIANLDENFGKLSKYLDESGVGENTIIIFMTDNGAPPHTNPFVKGFSGGKGSPLEGGHRVPFFMRWRKGGFDAGRDISAMVAHVDIMPTLCSMCDVDMPKDNLQDGVDFSPILFSNEAKLDERSIFIHHRQDSKAPDDVVGSVIMRDNWRLISGNKLYNLESDRVQKENIAEGNEKLIEQLLCENRSFIEKTKELDEYQNFLPSIAGTEHQKTTVLTIQHAIGEGKGLWESEQIAQGIQSKNNGYAVDFATEGKYRISVARWPRECQGTIWGVPEKNPKNWFKYEVIKPEMVKMSIGGHDYQQNISADMKEVVFDLDMSEGKRYMSVDFVENGESYGAYYIYIEKI